MEKYYPRDTSGAFYRQTDEVVPDAWMEGMVSLVQLKMLEKSKVVDERDNISKHIYK